VLLCYKNIVLIVLECALDDSVSGYHAKYLVVYVIGDTSFLLLGVKIVTLSLFASIRRTFFCSVIEGMVLKFFPTMTHVTVEVVLTAITGIVRDKYLEPPINTGLF
jgi:hypothetical protein